MDGHVLEERFKAFIVVAGAAYELLNARRWGI